MNNAIRLLSCIAALAAANTASAAQRTFVASYGLAANTAFNCSIVKPCRAFSEAISVTDPAGEVIVLDSAGYGPVTITKSVSVIAPAGVYAGVSVLSGDGIVVAASASEKIILRGLTINGQGGARGIVFLTGDQLLIDRCTVSGMTGNGIELGLASGATTIVETSVERNGGHGIEFVDRPTGTSTGALASVRSSNNGNRGFKMGAGSQVSITSSHFQRNGTGGVWAITGVSSATLGKLDLTRSVVSNNGSEGVVVVVQAAAATFMQALIADNVVSDNSIAGIETGMSSAAAGGLRVVVSRNDVRGHAVGIYFNRANTAAVMNGNVVAQSSSAGVTIINGAVVRSGGDNVVDDNTVNEDGSAVPANFM